MGGARGEAELQGGVTKGAWLRVTSRHLAGCGVPPCHAWRGAAGGGMRGCSAPLRHPRVLLQVGIPGVA